MHNVFVFVPAFGQQISATTFLTSHHLQQVFAQKAVMSSITTMSFPDIAELRNMAMTIWYDAMPQSSHLLFIDADMGFPPDLVLDMLLFGEPVVGACYPKRVHPVQWSPSGTGEAQAELRGGFMRVEGVGMGCTLIRRDAISAMLANEPSMVDERIHLHPAKAMLEQAGVKRLIRAFDSIDIPARGKLSEDLSFCIRWARCGGQVWANVSHRMSHVGPYDFQGCYMEYLQQMHAAQQVAQQQAPAPLPEIVVDAPVPAIEKAVPEAEQVKPQPEMPPVTIDAETDEMPRVPRISEQELVTGLRDMGLTLPRDLTAAE